MEQLLGPVLYNLHMEALYNASTKRRADLAADPALKADPFIRAIVLKDAAQYCLDSLRGCRPLPLPK